MLQKDKKAVSVMIGYVLLVSLAIIMGGLIYAWMKTYVPNEGLECPDGTSLMIKEYKYNCSDLSTINLTIKNNGRFDVGGFYIHVSNDSSVTLPTKDISLGCQQLNSSIVFPYQNSLIFSELSENDLAPGEEIELEFDVSTYTKIYYIQIMATRWQKQNKILRHVNCDKYKEEINCQ